MSTAIQSVEARLRANPDDAETWKVYADWLLDQGDPRGELIMLESLAASDPSLRGKIATLTREHEQAWQPQVFARVEYERRFGFVCAATLRLGNPDDVGTIRRLLADPQARLLGALRLSFGDAIKAKHLRELAKQDFGRLRSLRASYHARGDGLIQAMVHAPGLALTSLDLRYSRLSDAGLIALVGCEGLAGLRTLHLHHNNVGVKGIGALAHAPTMARLERLDLRYNRVGQACAEALAAASVLGRLRILHLDTAELVDEGLQALAASTTLPRELVRGFRGLLQTRTPSAR